MSPLTAVNALYVDILCLRVEIFRVRQTGQDMVDNNKLKENLLD